jgi:type I restriction enzyme R subunit
MKFTEESLEQAVIELFEAEKYQHQNGMHIHKELSDVLLREDIKTFLLDRYSDDDITGNEIESIIRFMEVMPSSALYDSNKAIIKMISDGFVFKREDRSKKDLFIQLLDFETLENNLFKIVNQLEIQGYEKRIPDGIVYVNGLPLVVLEFKSAIKENTTIKDAYTQLTVRYRRDIPELFKYNALCVISDGVNNKSGSLFAPYDFFYAWRKIEGNEPLDKDGIDSLFTMIKGLFNQRRLLDVVRHFVYFPDTSTKEEKIVPRYPQYYAANKLFESIKRNMKPHGTGKGGTYFGATGCGKSFTMLYLTRLLMRSVHFQSPTIVLITDRTDLDDQLSGQFTNAKSFIGDDQVISVENRAELKTYLQSKKSGGVFLTTIHKFNEDTDLLTERTNVICISDEAHRSQINLDQKIKLTKDGVEKKYGFAKHLHDSLPNATYVGFTGTPIDATMAVFGKVEDSYTMKESVYDEITVRIVYEGRAAKVILNNTKLHEIENYYKVCETAGANEYQIDESKRAVTQMDVILGDPKRLKLVAQDFVEHYEKRIEEGATLEGKVMYVASSRPVAYDLYKQIID